jgi:hypothetical protein
MIDLYVCPRESTILSLLEIECVIFVGLGCGTSNESVKYDRISFYTGAVDAL